MFRIGIDVGGTFTDFTLLDEASGAVRYHKVPSTPQDPSEAIERGIADLLEAQRIPPGKVTHVGHGTTVATNLVIERKGAVTGLLTTRGFRDVLEIGRQTRPHLYDYRVVKPPPLARREHRIEIHERVNAAGEVLAALDEGEVERAAMRLREEGVRAVAICFLHSYRNPEHERRARAVVERVMPDAYISTSSEVLPEFREFERLSTTVLNAAVGPRMERYLERFLGRVQALGIAADPYTIHSNGGLMSARAVRAFPVRTCLSGPAAGVVGAAAVGLAAGYENLVTFDVGGTSTDVSLVWRGRPLFSSNRAIADYPVKTPMVDIHVIGAGGGSIAWMDDAGALKVGPKSAGADPGPAAYANGGTEPTITDAHICLRHLNPVALLDGRLAVDEQAASAAIERAVARPLGLKVEAAAEGVIRIANANMSRAIRSVSTERGYDLTEFALFAYGGAGPLHATEIAAECGIPVVVVPQEPGTLCARGMLLTDISFDFVRSELAGLTAASWGRACELFSAMEAEAAAWLERERVLPQGRSYRYCIDARYEGQNFEVIVPLPQAARDGMDAFIRAFHAAHRQEYGYDLPGKAIEIVNCRLQAVGRVPKAPLRELGNAAGRADAAVTGRRTVYHGAEHGWVETPVYARAKLGAGAELRGPAVIEEMSSTVLLGPGQVAKVDRIGNIIIDIRPVTGDPRYPVPPATTGHESTSHGSRIMRIHDPIAMEVFTNRLLSITEDMNNTLVRSSFSTNIKERRDCSVALFDGRGRLIAQGTQIPLHLGSLSGGVAAVLRAHPVEMMRDGDAFISNDPYLANGTHLPDITIVTPVFFEGKIEFFAANIGHHADVGGAVPGSIAGGSRSIFEEGIRIPVVRIVRAGELDEGVLNLITCNTRDPEERSLDLKVQIATNERGAAAARALARQMGIASVRQSVDDVIEYTRRRIRNRIAELERGEYSFTTHLDDDGMGGDPVPITVTVRVAGDTLAVDFTGTGPQARGAMNIPLNALEASVYYSVKALLDPELPPNAGLFDAVRIHAPEGTIVNPRPPAAVGARSITCQKVAGAIFGAFRGVLPRGKVMASGNDVVPAIVYSGELTRRRGHYVYLETLGGGSGARADADGMDAVHVHMTNTSNLPAEALENEYPLLVDEYALVEDSGGAGKQRGGLGIARQIRAVVPGTIFSVRSDSHTVGVPSGVFGGGDGRRARLVKNPGAGEEVLYSKVARVEMKVGDAMRIETPGAGGYGAPAERALADLAADLKSCKVSRAAAERDYGVEKVAKALSLQRQTR